MAIACAVATPRRVIQASFSGDRGAHGEMSLRSRVRSSTLTGHLALYLLLVGVLTALTPWAIIGAIVLLGSRAGPRAAVGFVAGWFCSIAFIASVIAAGMGGRGVSSKEQVSHSALIVELLIGLALVVFAARRWLRNRSLPAATISEPAWLAKLDRMGPIVAFAFGTFMVNVIFVVDAGLRIADADTSPVITALALLLYAVLSTALLFALLAIFFSDRARSAERFAVIRAWVAGNNANVIAGMLAAVGTALALKGLIGLVT
jgi:hypothetical protein